MNTVIPINFRALAYTLLLIHNGQQLPVSYAATKAMAYDGCFHDNEIDLSSYPELLTTPSIEQAVVPINSPVEAPTEGTRLWRKRSFRHNISFIMSNSYMIDSYSRIIFPLAYLLFNIIYWSLYS